MYKPKYCIDCEHYRGWRYICVDGYSEHIARDACGHEGNWYMKEKLIANANYSHPAEFAQWEVYRQLPENLNKNNDCKNYSRKKGMIPPTW